LRKQLNYQEGLFKAKGERLEKLEQKLAELQQERNGENEAEHYTFLKSYAFEGYGN